MGQDFDLSSPGPSSLAQVDPQGFPEGDDPTFDVLQKGQAVRVVIGRHGMDNCRVLYCSFHVNSFNRRDFRLQRLPCDCDVVRWRRWAKDAEVIEEARRP